MRTLCTATYGSIRNTEERRHAKRALRNTLAGTCNLLPPDYFEIPRLVSSALVLQRSEHQPSSSVEFPVYRSKHRSQGTVAGLARVGVSEVMVRCRTIECANKCVTTLKSLSVKRIASANRVGVSIISNGCRLLK